MHIQEIADYDYSNSNGQIYLKNHIIIIIYIIYQFFQLKTQPGLPLYL